MSWRDREYARDEYGGFGSGRRIYRGPGMGALSISTTILLANIAVFFLMYYAPTDLGNRVSAFGVMQAEAVLHGQVWRLFTATYMHASFGHIFMNMLGLYFLGPMLERVWGPRQFLLVYTLGGVAGNVLLTLAGAIGFIGIQTLGLGASGSVLTLMGAAAVLFPDAEVYVYFLFPVRIRTAVAVIGVLYVFNIINQKQNYGGDICHVAGLAVGLWWAYSGGVSLSGRHRTTVSPNSLLNRLGGWLRRKPASRNHFERPGGEAGPRASELSSADEQAIDRILAKVYDRGLHTLTEDEKRILMAATERRRGTEAGGGPAR